MPLLAALWPLAMLGLVIALGRYEDALLRPRKPHQPPEAEPSDAAARGRHRRTGPYGRAASIDRYRHSSPLTRLPAHPLVLRTGAPQRLPRRHGHRPSS